MSRVILSLTDDAEESETPQDADAVQTAATATAPWYIGNTNSTAAHMESTLAMIPVTAVIRDQITMIMPPITTRWGDVPVVTSGGCSSEIPTINCVPNAHNHDGVGARKSMY